MASTHKVHGLRYKFDVQNAGQTSEEEEFTFVGLAGFCLFCALLTLGCAYCNDDDREKQKQYRGSAFCFVMILVFALLQIFFEEEGDEYDDDVD